MKITFVIDKEVIEVVGEEGRTLLDIALIAGLPVPYSCMSGSCGTCEANVDGKLGRTCQITPTSDQDLVVDYNKG